VDNRYNGPLDDNHPQSHGTCVASVACSSIGIMTRGTLVAIKASRKNIDPLLFLGDICIAFGWAINHIAENKRQGKSVINLSLALGKSIVYKMAFVHTNLL
jgi:hypothetical protein